MLRNAVIGLVCLFAWALTPTGASAIAQNQNQTQTQTQSPLKIVMLSGSEEYQSDESLDTFAMVLRQQYPTATCLVLKAVGTNRLDGLEALKTCDVVVFFTRRLTITGDDLARVQAYCASGKPIVGIRTASHGFQNWLEMDALVFGGNYKGHYGKTKSTTTQATELGQTHPILQGVGPLTSTASLYKTEPLADDCQRLMIGNNTDASHAVAWTRIRAGGQRVFYTSLGAPDDFANPAFRQLLINAISWSTQQPAPKPKSKPKSKLPG